MNARFIISDTDLISIKEVEHTTGMKKKLDLRPDKQRRFPPAAKIRNP